MHCQVLSYGTGEQVGTYFHVANQSEESFELLVDATLKK